MAADFDLDRALARLDGATPRREAGRVTEVTGLVIRASVPGVRVGELVTISSAGAPAGSGGAAAAATLDAEVVGFRGDEVVLMPLGETTGIGPDALVTPTGRPFSIAASERMLGRVLDGLGRPIDGAGPIADATRLGGRQSRARAAVAPPRHPPAAAGRARAGRAADRR